MFKFQWHKATNSALIQSFLAMCVYLVTSTSDKKKKREKRTMSRSFELLSETNRSIKGAIIPITN